MSTQSASDHQVGRALADVRALSSPTLASVITMRAARTGEDPYLITDDGILTFADVHEQSSGLARGLAGLGVRPDDVVVVYMENRAEFVLIALALAKLGAAWMPISPDLRGSFLHDLVGRSGATLTIADGSLLEHLLVLPPSPTLTTIVVLGEGTDLAVAPEYRLVGFQDLADADPAHVLLEPKDVDTAAVLWSAGATGGMRGVVQSHRAWISAVLESSNHRLLRDDDVFYNCVPMYNAGAWYMNILAGLVTGRPVALDPSFSASRFWDRCRHFGATQIATLGAMHVFLMNQPPKPDDSDNPVRVGYCIPMPEELAAPFRQRFGIEFLLGGYGRSECMPCTFTTPGRTWKANSCGMPRSDVELAVLDEVDEPCQAGDVGEICLRPRTPFVMFSGYHDDGAGLGASSRNWWFHTGDLGVLDADGELFFAGVKAGYMRYKGRNVSASDVERVIRAHPLVAEVAVHGVASAELASEEEIKACVVLASGASLSPEELARFVNVNAPYYMVPRYVEMVDDLPRLSNGLVDSATLRARGNLNSWDAKAAGFEVSR